MGCRKALLLARNTTGVHPLALYAVAFVPAFVNIASVALCSVLLLKRNVTPKLIKRLTRNPRIAFLVLEAAARSPSSYECTAATAARRRSSTS